MHLLIFTMLTGYLAPSGYTSYGSVNSQKAGVFIFFLCFITFFSVNHTSK